MQTSSTRRNLTLALLTDAATLVLMAVLMPALGSRLSSPSGMNTLLLATVYITFLVGIFLLRKLLPTPPATGTWLTPSVRGILAGIFGLVLTTALAWQLGFFESVFAADPRVLGEGEAAAYFVFAPGAWIGVSMLYILFLAFPVNETMAATDGRYLVFAILGLLTTAAMLITLVAQGQVMLPGTAPTMWFVAAVVMLLLLFVPPRLLYVSRVFPMSSRAAIISVLSLAVVAAAGAWLMVAG